jgi:hypothetical protein
MNEKLITNFQRRKSMQGQKNPNWKGGVSEYPDHYLMKKIRIELLKRCRGKCEICGNPVHEIHHIDESKNNHDIENLLAVCKKCHSFLHAKFSPKEKRIKSNTKYTREFGLSLSDMAEIFGTNPTTIWYWIKSPIKREWLKKQLSNKNFIPNSKPPRKPLIAPDFLKEKSS